jgi:hypothetical protein
MEKRLEEISSITNRSLAQTTSLFGLVDEDFSKLTELEDKIKNNHLSYCPSTKEEVEEILLMSRGSGWWNDLAEYS